MALGVIKECHRCAFTGDSRSPLIHKKIKDAVAKRNGEKVRSGGAAYERAKEAEGAERWLGRSEEAGGEEEEEASHLFCVCGAGRAARR
jgi:hypothetical protein